jgi:hypothetical protein
MNSTDIVTVMQFQKDSPAGILHCELQVFADRSAYVRGDELEIVFEESPDAWQEAIKCVESQGYQLLTDTGT